MRRTPSPDRIPGGTARHAAVCRVLVRMLMLVLTPMLICGTTAMTARRAAAADPPDLTDKPLKITADKMIASQDEAMVQFIGNVHAVQSDSVIDADAVTVYFQSADTPSADKSPKKKMEKEKNRNQVKQIVAEGHVTYTSGNRKAVADRAVYTTADQVLVLTGKAAKLLTGTSWVTGNKITLFRAEDRAMVESEGSNRVQALFNPEDNPDDH